MSDHDHPRRTPAPVPHPDLPARSGGRPGLLIWGFALLLGVFFAGQTMRPLTDSSEARYAESAREMLVTGQWLVPTLNLAPHLTKPPVTTWLMSGSMALFGVNEFAARLPGWIAFLLTVGLLYRIPRLLGRPEASAWAAFLYALSLGPLVASTFPTTDTLLTLFEVASVAAYLEHRRGSPRARLLFFAALGLGFLTKGPPALLVPAAVIIGDRLLRRRDQTRAMARDGGRRLLTYGPGWLLFAAVGLGWYLVIALRQPETLGYWLKEEVVYRVFTGHHRRRSSPLIFEAVLLAGLLPWWFLIPSWLKRQAGTIRSRWRSGARPLLLAWLGLPLLVFTISQSRLALYVLPLFPALVLALALDRPRTWHEVRGRWFGIRPAALLGYGAVLAAISLASIPLAGSSSWKSEAASLQALLPSSPIEVIAFHQGRINSLQFYLETPAEIVLADGRPSTPRWESLAEEMRETQEGDEGRAYHLYLARGDENRQLLEASPAPPTLVKKRGRYSLWLQEPTLPDSAASPADSLGSPRFVVFNEANPRP